MTISKLRGHSKRIGEVAVRRQSAGGASPRRWGRALALLVLGISALVIACSGGSEPTPSDDWNGAGERVATTRQGLKKGTAGAVNGDDDYCNDAANKCAKGEGDCDNSSQCLSGLVCTNDNGPKYGLPPGSEACAPAHCGNGILDADEVTIDCSPPGPDADCGVCLPACGSSLPPGSVGFCSGCICASGQGDCVRDADCQPGLVCTRVGTRFGFSQTTDVCVPPHCVNGTFDQVVGELDVDCGGECGACLPNCSGASGGETFCEGCRCQSGQGDCDGDEQCQRGLTCQSNVGTKFNLARLDDACVATHCTNGVLDGAVGEILIDCGGECGACPITDFDAGTKHACQVSQGNVLCWGSNSSGQLGFDAAIHPKISVPTLVPGLPAGQALATAGGLHSCALSSGGVLKCWGDNGSGQLGNGNTTDSYSPVTVSGAPSGMAQIVSGEKHVCVRTTTGTVWCWGDNTSGQLGNGMVGGSQTTPLLIAGLPAVTHLSAGLNHTCAALTDGTVRCWGANDSGKLGNGGTASSGTPVVVPAVTGATQVSTGSAHTCALKSDGTVYCWGNNTANRLAIDTATTGHLNGLTPALVPGVTVAISLASTDDSTCIARSSAGGFVYCWGAGAKGQIGAGSTVAVTASPTQVLVTSRTTVLKGGGEFMCANTTDAPGVLRCWGDDNLGQLGKGTVNFQGSPEVVWPPPKAATVVDPGDLSTCAVAGGQVYCWGQNDNGQIGDNTYIQRRVPSPVSGITNATSVAVGNLHACAVLADGTMRCWGNNTIGQFGNGTTGVSAVPVANSVTSAVHVEAAAQTTCALLANGTISCWGRGTKGELGNGATVTSLSPVTVSLPSAASALSVGLQHGCAIVGGNVFCWGVNADGELGDGSTTNRSTPVQVTGLSDVVWIAAGHHHSCAIVSSGQAYCWGGNSDGQLGGNYIPSLTPVPVEGISNARSISAWGSFTCAILKTGELRCWGQNTRGQLGSGLTLSQSPIPQTAPGVWTSVSAGGRHACGLLTSGQIRCWGYNDYGQTGNGKAWIFPEGATAFPPVAPSTADSQCFSNGDCSHGQVCWLQQGPRFDLPLGSNVCVNAECLNTPTPSCGTVTMKCGKCDNGPRSCDGTPGSCHLGETCGVNNGGYLGISGSPNGCWTAGCEEPAFREENCGTVNSVCGECPSGTRICTTDANCPSGQVCGIGEGPRFGFGTGTNVCWHATCATNPAAACGSMSSRCGLCAERETGCQTAAQCVAGLACWIGGGPSFGFEEETNVCAQPRCVDDTASPEDCSGLGAACGDCCATEPEAAECGSFDAVDTEFTYDALGRLTAVAQDGTTREGYGYDRMGNRCTVSIGPGAQVSRYCPSGEVDESYTSTWVTSGSAAASYSDGDGTFSLIWEQLPGTVALKLSHEAPGQPVTLIDLDPDTVSQSYSHLASGLHRFVVFTCFIEYDINNDPFRNCDSFMRFDITVN